MTERSLLALEEAVLKTALGHLDARKKALAARYDEVRTRLRTTLAQEDVDRQPVKLPDGSKIGTVTYTPEKTGPKVTDEDALIAFLRTRARDQLDVKVVTTIRPAYLKALLAEIEQRGETQILDETTGELIDVPGVEFGTVRDAYHTYRPGKDATDAIAQAWRDGQFENLGLPRELAPAPGPDTTTGDPS